MRHKTIYRSVSFLHDLNKHNVYRGMKLTVPKSMLLMQMSMLVLTLLETFVKSKPQQQTSEGPLDL